MSRSLAVAFLLAGQCADVMTYAAMDQANEANPIIITLGPALAITLKVAVVALVLAADRLLREPTTLAVVLFGGALGFVGALTNVL